jgi:DinB superfamily
MDLVMLREEYDLARRYTQSLYADLSDTEVQWRPTPTSSSIAWHLGHQAAVTHLLVRNLISAEPSLDPSLDALFDAANPPENRGTLPSLAEIIAYRESVAERTHAHLATVLEGDRPVAHDAGHQVARIMGPIVVSLINHEYQHDCWVREMRALLNQDMPDRVLSRRVRQIDGYWGLTVMG